MTAIATLKNAVNVALRKESVDRNIDRPQHGSHVGQVALRKESVDRNDKYKRTEQAADGRSPQGERG